MYKKFVDFLFLFDINLTCFHERWAGDSLKSVEKEFYLIFFTQNNVFENMIIVINIYGK
jgi:hypothetical protein